MKITDLLKVEGIKLNASAKDKDDAINQLVDLQVRSGNISDKEKYKKGIYAREAESTTAMGEGIAIPHAKTDAVKKAGLVAMTVPGGVDYDAPDGEPSNLFFMIAAPNTKDNIHLEVLSRLATMLMDEEFVDNLRAAKSSQEFLGVIDNFEKAHMEAEEKKAEAAAAATSAGNYPDILAITACPTGIAHTYMAAENLEKKAKEMGLVLKAETQGSVGAKNILTADEIAHAKGIIIAADKNVDLARFGGKQVYQCSVSKGINEPEKLINLIMNNEAPVLDGSAPSGGAAAQEKDSVAHTFYKNLMNGVSHMLPFVVGGGILIAISFLLDGAGRGTSSFGSSTPVAHFFNAVGNAAFGFMLPILAGYIAMSIADRPGLTVGFVGGALAVSGMSYGVLLNPDSAAISGGFIGALFAGFAAGYITKGLEKLCDKLPASLEGIKPVLLYPLLGTLCIGLLMFAVNPIFAAINTGITGVLSSMGTTNLVLLGAVVGGMMSIDMGGPFNKAAYVFGTAMLAEGTTAGQIIMASVMVGGMVPPLAIAFSTTFFKNRWTKADRDAGLVNYIMGLSFISEGAIPYAAADPGRVLPSCIIGSAVAGAISAAAGCTSPAPHGGFWVIAIIGNPAMYTVALLVGSLLAALILSIMKKPLPPEESGLAK
ncbi:MAG: fructose-specific PTS transporter subunit EIIC [Lachnospiraceae bacterium]|nr:fructose-specific PTS transporter subunit EIIC [Lachnospiraceae bacterium]